MNYNNSWEIADRIHLGNCSKHRNIYLLLSSNRYQQVKFVDALIAAWERTHMPRKIAVLTTHNNKMFHSSEYEYKCAYCRRTFGYILLVVFNRNCHIWIIWYLTISLMIQLHKNQDIFLVLHMYKRANLFSYSK